MAYKYEFSDAALKDIEHTLNYISNELCNRKAADDLIIEINKTIKNICLFPMSYPNCEYYYIKNEMLRHIRIKKFILTYKIIEDKILILSFRYYKQNKIM